MVVRHIWQRALRVTAALALALLGFTVMSGQKALAACTTYYISTSGNDSNSGCSSSSPWQTLTQVNATTFAAGNQILFQDGGSWTGELHPLGSGSSGNPIVISTYGSGAAPIIAGNGAAAAVYLDNQSYWTIENLEVTNTASSAAIRSGIQLQNDTSGILNSIHIVNNNIHDVTGYWSTSQGQPSNSAGIGVNQSDSYTTNGWDDLLIQGNSLNHTDAAGIYVGSVGGNNHSTDNTNVVITNNTMNDAGGNDIVCLYCASPVVEYNVATNSGYRYSGAGFWMTVNTNGVWQYNEIARQWRNLYDGEAFDMDWGNNGVTIQYNYTHDNPFGFYEFCCRSSFGATNGTVRDNISQNDGLLNSVFSTFSGDYASGAAQIYNNTVYVGPGDNGGITNDCPSISNLTMSNNIFYVLGSGGYASCSTITWTHNTFFGNHPSSEPADSNKLTSDPLFVAPGGAGYGRSTASAYEVQPSSPELGSGTLISNNGGLDFFGNSVSSTAAPNRGAYNGSGVAQTQAYGAYWTFDQGSGTYAPDAFNHGNNGTLQAGASWTTGEVGPNAISLNGASNSWVDVPSPALDTSQSYSVAAWVKLNSVTGGNQTFASIDGSNISPFYLQLSAGKFTFTERSSDSTSSSYTQVIGLSPTTGTWYHVVGTYDNSAHSIALWVNGVLQGTASYSSPWKATGHTTIGRAKWNGNNVDFTNGAIDDARMYSRVLDRQEIVALATVPAADFELDEGTGTQTANFFANTPPGTLTGNATWATGKVGSNAISLDGSTGTGVDIESSAVDTSQSYSVAAWVKFNSVTGGNQTFASICGNTICPFYLQVSGGKFTFVVRSSDSTSSSYTLVTGLSPSTGTWYHVVGTYDNSAHSIALWVNGTLQNTASFSSPWKANGYTMIGHALWNAAGVDWTNGTIDDVHFYSRVLTSTEIGELAAG